MKKGVEDVPSRGGGLGEGLGLGDMVSVLQQDGLHWCGHVL